MKTHLLFLAVACTVSAQQYTVSTIAGSATPPTPALSANSSVGNTNSVARDAGGNVYFSSGESVFKADAGGILTLVAGNGTIGYSGDGGPATQAQLSNPWGVAVDQAGNVYIADELNNRIRRVSSAGVITTVAGIGSAGFSGDGGAAADAELHFPLNVTLDAAGNLYIADYFNNRIRKVSPDGIIVTIAGGSATYPGDGGLATNAALAGPAGMAVDAAGNIFVADRGGMRVRKISANGIISTVAGTGASGFSGDDGPAINAQMYLPSDVAVDAGGNLYIADFNNNRIRKVSSAGTITSFAPGVALNGPSGVALDTAGNVYIADRFNNRIEVVSSGGLPTLLAGNGSAHFSGDGGSALKAQLNNATGVAVDQFNNLFIADSQNGRIREVSPAGTITTFAGGGFTITGSPATNFHLVMPQGVALDTTGNLYIADSGAQQVFKVTPSGAITVVAGTGSQGNSGDGGQATAATLFNPTAVAADGAGDVFIISQSGNPANTFISGNSVRKVTPDGTITTLIPATTIVPGTTVSQSFSPNSIAVDSSGNLFVEETSLLPPTGGGSGYSVQVLKLSPAGVTTVVAQTGGAMGVDGAGNLILVGTNTLQKIGTGAGVTSFPINGTVAANAIAIDSAGRIYAAQQYSVLLLQQAVGSPTNSLVTVNAVVDAASESILPISPGKIVAIYGVGLGPAQGISNQAVNGVFGTSLSGTTITFNGFAAPILYTSATEVVAIVPYAATGQTVQVIASYQAQLSPAITVAAAPVAPSLFTRNQTGAGQAAVVNVTDGTLNTAANPAKIGSYVSLYATGEGQTTAPGVDGQLGGTTAKTPNSKVTASIGGIPANVQYAGGVFGVVSGLMQVNVQIPAGVTPGGYVPVVLQVGGIASNAGTWIAVSGN